MKAMVLAAGLGTRMGSLTTSTPKPLLEVGGETLIGRQLARLAAAGVTEAIVNVARHGDKIREAVGDGRHWGLRVEYSDEGPEPLETAGGILQALTRLGAAPFVVANADVLTDFDFGTLELGDAEGQIVLVPNPVHHGGGDFALDDRGFVVADGARLTYAGIALFDPAMFRGRSAGRAPLKPILDAAIARRRLRGVRHDGLWIDVGTPERLDEAREIVQKRGQSPLPQGKGL
jgi:N-acetyl-alpha-D-muramate 1-phosphate uridylyltransferase